MKIKSLKTNTSLLVLIIMFTFCNLYAQTDSLKVVSDTLSASRFVKVKTSNNNTYSGRVIKEDREIIVLDTELLGEITIKKIYVTSIENIEQKDFVDKDYWGPTVQDSRYFYAPSGYGMKRRQGYYQNILLFHNHIALSFGENFSVGFGGMPLIELYPMWITPKVSIPIIEDRWNLGIGTLLAIEPMGMTFSEGKGENSLMLPYMVSTFGNRNKNLTLGFGAGQGQGDKFFMFNLSYMNRISSRSYFISENHLITPFRDSNTKYMGIGIMGFRTNFETLSLDYGFGVSVTNKTRVIPWLGLIFPFKSKYL